MIPSKRWFPTTLVDRAAWIDNFAKQFAKVALSLGFSAADVTSMTQDAEDFRALAKGQPPPKPSCPVFEAFVSL